MLDGPNVYRLEPVVKLELAVGRRRTWYGQRDPDKHALVQLGAAVPARDWPDPVAAVVAWVRRLRADHGEGRGGLAVHRSSDPGHWIVTYPWSGEERARILTEAAVALAERDVSPSRTARLTGAQERGVGRWIDRIASARTTPPSWLRDADRRIPAISISGTNGKSTVSRLITHILIGRAARSARRRRTACSSTSAWSSPATGPGPLAPNRSCVAPISTSPSSRRPAAASSCVGWATNSNDASVLTNVSSDHLDLQGIHTLPELAEVKSTICRVTKPSGWVVLNGDDPLVASVGRRVKAHVALFSIAPGSPPAVVGRHIARGGRAYLVRDGWLTEVEGDRASRIVEIALVPITIGGLARHNVANALAAAGGARGMGATLAQVRDGLLDFAPSAERSPGRLNMFRLGARIVIVDFAHNEAGITAVMDVAEGIAAGAAGRTAPITAIIGTAGDRPDDTLRGIGRIAAQRAQRVAIKETLKYLRGRTPASVIGELLAGVKAGGGSVGDVPVYHSETAALRAELNGASGAASAAHGQGRGADAPRIIVLMCHEEREEVFELLASLGGRPVDIASELTTIVPRLQERPRRA